MNAEEFVKNEKTAELWLESKVEALLDKFVDKIVSRLNGGLPALINAKEATALLNVSKQTLTNICNRYPEFKPKGKNSHLYSRDFLIRYKAREQKGIIKR